MSNASGFRNWKVVVLSLLGAITFWFFSALGKNYNYRINYPIEFIYNTDSLIPVRDLPKYVNIDVNGVGWDLLRQGYWFGAEPVRFPLENAASTKFLTRAALLPEVSEQLNQFSINFLLNDTLFLDIDERTSKTISLYVDSLAIGLEDNYRIVSPIQIAPDSVEVFGPSSFIDTLSSKYLCAVPGNRIDDNYDRFVKIGLPDEFEIYSDPLTVNVKFQVDRFDRLEIPVQVELLNFPLDSSVFIQDSIVNLQFVVQRSKIEEYQVEDFKVVLDYNMMTPKDSIAPVIIVLYPELISQVEVKPDSIRIKYAQ
jgi:hypothetical protein